MPAGSPGLAVAQQYAGNPSGFLTALATRYFSVTTAAVRMYDPNHLILGVKAEGQEIEPNLVKAAAPYVDVFSIEDYTLGPGGDQAVSSTWPSYLSVEENLADIEAVANVPLMIGEYSFSSTVNTSNDPDTYPPIYVTASSQQQRANQFENFIAPLYEDTPALVGDDWFQYVDEPPGGRTGDGENSDFGMIDVHGNPYPTMVAAMQLMHNTVADETGDNGPVCDSWATGSSGVACTADMPSPATTPLTIVTTSLPAGNVGSPYNNLTGGIYAAGGTPGYTYTITQGSLPNGLTLNATSGIISGSPTATGTSSFTVQATDSGGSQPVTQALSITVNAESPLSTASTSLPIPTVGQSYIHVLGEKGGAAPYTWAVSGGALPSGITLSSAGILQGVPTVAGTFNFTVRVTDSSTPAQSATSNLTLYIGPATTVILPAAGATAQGTTVFDATASSQNGIASVQVRDLGRIDQRQGRWDRSRHHLWLSLDCQHGDDSERDLRSAGRGDRQSGSLCDERAGKCHLHESSDDERARALQRRHGFRYDVPRRLRHECDQRPVPALRRFLWLCSSDHLHRNADCVRMVVRLGQHHGSRLVLYPRLRGHWSGRDHLQFGDRLDGQELIRCRRLLGLLASGRASPSQNCVSESCITERHLEPGHAARHATTAAV